MHFLDKSIVSQSTPLASLTALAPDQPILPSTVSVRNLFTQAHLDLMICQDIFKISYTDFINLVHTRGMSRSKAITRLVSMNYKNTGTVIYNLDKKLSFFPNLMLYTTVKGINSIYDSCDSSSCESKCPVGKFYRSNKIGVIGSSNFRTLVNLKTGKLLASFYGSFSELGKEVIPDSWTECPSKFISDNNYRRVGLNRPNYISISHPNDCSIICSMAIYYETYRRVTISPYGYTPYYDFYCDEKTITTISISKKNFEVFKTLPLSTQRNYDLYNYLAGNPYIRVILL